jgi:hypothetical protein
MTLNLDMKSTFSFLNLVTLVVLLSSCGGVIGNIEKYEFSNVNVEIVKTALNKVYAKYPEVIKSDTTMYGNNNGEDFYFFINVEGQKIVFKCNVIAYPAPYDKKTDLSLTTATIWGKTMKLAPEMGFFEKRKYRKLFEESILPKIKEEINGH